MEMSTISTLHILLATVFKPSISDILFGCSYTKNNTKYSFCIEANNCYCLMIYPFRKRLIHHHQLKVYEVRDLFCRICHSHQ